MSNSWNLDTYSPDKDNVAIWPKNRDVVKIPPIILFGYFNHDTEVPMEYRSRFPKLNIVWMKAMRAIFMTGNHLPHIPFSVSDTSLQHEPHKKRKAPLNWLSRWRAEREFRACLWLKDIKLAKRNGNTFLIFGGAAEVGWTPPSVKDLATRSKFPHFSRGYSRGLGNLEPGQILPIFYEKGVRLKVDIGFRINRLRELFGSFVLFGKGVPLMRMILELDIKTDGSYNILFNGSYIPSQIYQVGSKFNVHYDMVSDIGDIEQVRKALGAGFNKRSPERTIPFSVSF